MVSVQRNQNLLCSAYTIKSRRVHNGYVYTRKPEDPVATQSKKLEVTQREIKDDVPVWVWKLPGEALVWIHTERPKQLGPDVHWQWQ